MQGSLKQVGLGFCLLVAVGLGCAKPRPILPRKPVPEGTVLFQFTKKVEGPLELTVDGLRIPVEQDPGLKCLRLTISGLALGKHHLILLSQVDAFSPDQIDVELVQGGGFFKVLLAQQFKSVLYGKPPATPPADAIPGVKAVLEP